MKCAYGDEQAEQRGTARGDLDHTELARAPGHPFYERLNEMIEKAGSTSLSKESARVFITRGWVGHRCGRTFTSGRHFEGIEREHGLAWRIADSWHCGGF
jgi:hypothetical protein